MATVPSPLILVLTRLVNFSFPKAHPEKHDRERFEINALPADRPLVAASTAVQTVEQIENVLC